MSLCERSDNCRRRRYVDSPVYGDRGSQSLRPHLRSVNAYVGCLCRAATCRLSVINYMVSQKKSRPLLWIRQMYTQFSKNSFAL